jgi:hypothetical protein
MKTIRHLCIFSFFVVFHGNACMADTAINHPLIAERIVFNWHNFLSGCSTWNYKDWTNWTEQSQKMGYNAIMVHAYGNNPMAAFTFQGREKPVGYLSTTVRGRDWNTMHVNDVRRLVGGEVFDGPVFGAEAGMVPDTQRVEAAKALMSRVFADAAERGMGVFFAMDVDTPSANPQDLVTRLPESARFKPRNSDLWLPNPDTPEGYAYFRSQVEGLLTTYPQISTLTVWFRAESTPWINLKPEDLPKAWQKEYAAEVARTPGAEKFWNSAGLFSIGKIVSAYERAREEIGAKHTRIAAGSWRFQFLPAADRFFPKNVPLIGLDYEVIDGKSRLDTPESRAQLAEIGARRPLIPVIWAHHDDGQYLGRPYTPFRDFHSKLVESKAAGFGVIHWTTRPFDLYFASHARQVFSVTKDEPLRTTCEVFARENLGEPVMGEYLYAWITQAPQFGRETSDYFIDRPLANTSKVVAGCRQRLALLGDAKGPQADYFRGLEHFVASFYETHDLFQRSQAALKNNDSVQARQLMSQCDPEGVIEQFAKFSSIGGTTRGEQGLIVTMNLRWLTHMIRHRQALGLEPVRIKFGPTQHDPLAQSPGKFTFYSDVTHKFWEVWGKQECGARVFTKLDAREELARTGVQSDQPISFNLRPIMAVDGRNTSQPAFLPAGKYRLRLLLLDPDSTAAGQRLCNIVVRGPVNTEVSTFDPVKAGFLRLRCRGTSDGDWNSLHQVHLDTLAQVGGSPRVTASSAAEGHPAEHAIDGNPTTRWAAQGTDEWLQFRLDPKASTGRIGLDWYKAGQRQEKFTIETSSDGKQWIPVRNLHHTPDEDMAKPTTVDVFKEAGGANRLWEHVVSVTVGRPGSVIVTLTPVKGTVVISGMNLEPLDK